MLLFVKRLPWVLVFLSLIIFFLYRILCNKTKYPLKVLSTRFQSSPSSTYPLLILTTTYQTEGERHKKSKVRNERPIEYGNLNFLFKQIKIQKQGLWLDFVPFNSLNWPRTILIINLLLIWLSPSIFSSICFFCGSTKVWIFRQSQG